MKEIKPEWYARMKNGPFQETFVTSEMIYKLEKKFRIRGRTPSKKSVRVWMAAGVMTLILVCAISLYPQLLSVLPFNQAASTSIKDQWTVTHGTIKQLLKIGMTEDEVIRHFGNTMERQAVIRDFAQPHVEDPNDISTWSKVDMWRYDFGVREGYKVESNIDEAFGFDLSGIANGDIKSQLVIVWKDGKVDRALYRFNQSRGSAITYSDIGPNTPAKP